AEGDCRHKASFRRTIASRNFAKERLARDAHHQRLITQAQARQIFQERKVVRERLAEPDSRIERQRHWINAATYGSSILLSKEFAHFLHHILIMWRFLHG